MQTIESSPRDEGYADEDITLSQLVSWDVKKPYQIII
jgi:hypothetical protein